MKTHVYNNHRGRDRIRRFARWTRHSRVTDILMFTTKLLQMTKRISWNTSRADRSCGFRNFYLWRISCSAAGRTSVRAIWFRRVRRPRTSV